MDFDLWFDHYALDLRSYFEDFLVEEAGYSRMFVSEVDDGWDEFVKDAFDNAPIEERFIIK